MESLNNNDLSEADIIKYHDEFKHVITNMYRSEYRQVQGRAIRKDLRLYAFCLYYQYITLEIFIDLQCNIEPNVVTERLFLSRLEKKGLLKVESFHFEPYKLTKVYSLTAKGIYICKGELSEFLKSNNYFDTKVDVQCLEFIYRRYDNIAIKKNFKHYIYLLQSIVYFISSSHIEECYYELEPIINHVGNVMNVYEKSSFVKSSNKSKFQVKADAYVRFKYEGHTLEHFIEQDTSTQRMSIIMDKVHAYCQYVFENSYDNNLQTLLFSLHRAPSVSKTKVNAAEPSLHLNNIRLALSCSLMDNNRASNIPLEDSSLVDILNSLDNSIKQLEDSTYLKDYSRFFSNTKKVIETTAADFRISTLEELIWVMQDKSNEGVQYKKAQLRDMLIKAYSFRKLAIFQSVLDDDIAMTSLKKGCSICTMPSQLATEYLSFLSCGLGSIEKNIYSIGYECDYLYGLSTGIIFEPLTQTYEKDHYVLRNHFTYPENKNIYVECISEDIGGYVRVREYLTTMKFSGESGLLICLISDDSDSYEMARNLWNNTLYSQTDRILTSPTLFVSFIRTSDLLKANVCPFVFDEEGNEIEFRCVD